MEYVIRPEPVSISPTASPFIQNLRLQESPGTHRDLDPNHCGLPAIYPLVLDNPNPDLIKKLYDFDADYVSFALHNLAAQLTDYESVVRSYFSVTGPLMFNVGLIGKFCALFQGFVHTGEIDRQDTGIPILDIEVPKKWVFEITSNTTKQNIASFALTIMGVSAGHGKKRIVQDSITVPNIKESCQAQVRAWIQWKRYHRKASGEYLYIGNIDDIIDGMVVRSRSDKEYKRIHTNRYANHVKQIGATTNVKKGKYSYFIENEASTAYAFDLPVLFGDRSVGIFNTTMSSTCNSKIAMNAEFPIDVYDIKGPTDNPVILSVVKASARKSSWSVTTGRT